MAVIKNPNTIIQSGGGGGDIVNGIIEEFMASTGTIDANTFVDFAKNAAGEVSAVTNTAYSGAAVSAVCIGDNRVLVVHNGVGSDSSSRLYGTVCRISGNTISHGPSTQLSSSTYGGLSISAVALSEDKVFIAHSVGGDSSYHYIYGLVCTISGTTITAGSDTVLSGVDSYSSMAVSATPLSPNKVFVACNLGGQSSASRLYGLVCTISGTTITSAGTQLSSSTYGGLRISAVALSEDKVFIAHNGGGSPTGTSSRLYGLVCTISDTTITAGSDTVLSTADFSSWSISAVALSEDKVFIAHSVGWDSSATSTRAGGLVCTISDTTITAGSDTVLSHGTAAGFVSAVKLADDLVYVACCAYGTALYHIFCRVIGTQLAVSSLGLGIDWGIYQNPPISTTRLPDGRFYCVYGEKSRTGVPHQYLGYATITPSTSVILGVTKTKATSSTAGEVWLLGQGT